MLNQEKENSQLSNLFGTCIDSFLDGDSILSPTLSIVFPWCMGGKSFYSFRCQLQGTVVHPQQATNKKDKAGPGNFTLGKHVVNSPMRGDVFGQKGMSSIPVWTLASKDRLAYTSAPTPALDPAKTSGPLVLLQPWDNPPPLLSGLRKMRMK